jgi:hypothetical protein
MEGQIRDSADQPILQSKDLGDGRSMEVIYVE